MSELEDRIEKSIKRITNTMSTIAEILIENNDNRQNEIKELNKRISTIEYTIARFETRLSKLERD